MDRSPSKFEKIINYIIVIIVLGLGSLILSGVFKINPTVRVPFGLAVVLYGLVRLGMIAMKYRKDEN